MIHSPLPCRLSSLLSTPPSAPQPPHPLLHRHAPPHHHTHLTCLCCYPQTSLSSRCTSWPVLRDGTVRPMPELLGLEAPIADDGSKGEVTCTDKWRVRDPNPNFRFPSSSSDKVASGSGGKRKRFEESVTTTACLESGIGGHYAPNGDRKVLNLFI